MVSKTFYYPRSLRNLFRSASTTLRRVRSKRNLKDASCSSKPWTHSVFVKTTTTTTTTSTIPSTSITEIDFSNEDQTSATISLHHSSSLRAIDDIFWSGSFTHDVEVDSDDNDNDDDSSCASFADDEFDTEAPPRTVFFDESVSVREYAVTVGDTPSFKDSCPITLDWIYRETSLATQITPIVPTAKFGVRRLGLEARRARIGQVQGWSREQVRVVEIERLLETMEEVMERQEAKEEKLKSLQLLDEERLSSGDEHPFSERSSALFASGRARNYNKRCTDDPLKVSCISRRVESVLSDWATEVSVEAGRAC